MDKRTLELAGLFEGRQIADSSDFESWKTVCKNTSSGSPVKFKGDKSGCVAIITKKHLTGPHEMGRWDGKKGKVHDNFKPLKEEVLEEGKKSVVDRIYGEVMSTLGKAAPGLSAAAKKAIRDGIQDAYEEGEDAGYEEANK